jgi:hypothetical protein
MLILGGKGQGRLACDWQLPELKIPYEVKT